MKLIKYICLALVLSAVTLSVQAASIIEEPAVMPEAMLSITAPDLHGLIDGIGSVAAKTSPMMNGMMIKNLVGMQLGDPGLAGFAQGKGLAVVALNTTNFFGVLEVAEAQSSGYAEAIQGLGMQTKYANGVLVVAQTPDLIAQGVAMTASVKSTLLAKRSATLRVAAQPNAVIERNDEQIQGFLEMIPALMGGGMAQAPDADAKTIEMTTKILEAEFRILLSVASQCKSGELVIAPENGSVRLSETFAPKSGSQLAKLMDSTKTVKANPKIQSGLLGEGMVKLDFVMGSPEALHEFAIAEMNNVVDAMAITNLDVDAIAEVMDRWMGLCGGTACEIVDFDYEDGLSVGYLLEVRNEKVALEVLKTMKKDMEPMLELYKNMGMDMEFEFKENVSEYKGVKIHCLEMEIEMDEMPAEQKKQMDAMDMDDLDYDIAIFDGLLLCTMGDNAINKAIDHIKNPSATIDPLKARSIYPAGGFYYCDIDVGRYVEMVSAFMPEGENPLNPQVVAMMQGVEPITSAGFRNDGLAMWSVNIPGDLIGKIGQISMMMQMQKMQQQQSMPQGMPAGMPGL